jgi:NtrC-family two-component system sensor histidine kinase KinB
VNPALPTLRRKILGSFWGIALLYGVLGVFLVISVQIASRTSPRMIHVNYDSIAAADQMREALSALESPSSYPGLPEAKAREQFEKALVFEEGNISEPGEKEVAQGIRASWEKLKQQEGPPSLSEFRKLNELLKTLVAVNELGMFKLASGNEDLSHKVMYGAIAFFLISLIAALFVADGLALRISRPLKSIAEALHRRPGIGKKLKLVEANTLELLILTTELTRLWERVSETEKVNVREIMQQKIKLESVLESVDDALLVIDREGKISHANQTLLELLGLPASDVNGKVWSDLSSVGENYIKLRALLNADLPDSSEVELFLKAAKHQFSARSRQIHVPSDGQVAMLYLLHDITEKRHRDRFRAEFIDLLSHEIKTPLQSLGTATELLTAKRAGISEELRPLIDTISEDVDRIKAVANEFVQITQSHSKVMKIKLEVTAMNQVIQEWIRPFHVVAKDRDVRVTYKQEGSEVIWADLDRVKFPWVISNLLSNAIRFSPAGSEVEVLLTDRNGAVEIQVKDDGPGVPEGDRQRIFDPFFQSPMPTGAGTRGLFGIGLTIAKEVVEAHDGRIEYFPRLPHGSEFRIVLPFPPG